MLQPHPDPAARVVRCGVITVSDTRSPETDKSGQLIQALLTAAGHEIGDYEVIKDDPEAIAHRLEHLAHANLEALIFSGGTGIAHRDNTYDMLAKHLEKTLPGFGEIFRALSYEEIGSRAIASRAVAGTYRGMILFSLPGSTGAVRLAMEKLILPELRHLVSQLQPAAPQV
ncbi:molybdenum cofactor biosynthesis protein B [Picosynechococcus sp. PCC 7117]|uniref:MogA/MoaB family molybdenum cofactor biosynthesis protein n=1 Tax=Picosynechococcus sp. PCC 7117 TaxID=195498 RepID=UPI000810F2AC|nr:MogA/MoaB family molybdenum cofactor biosynthesis protein [Picosynechococcus sp. PCC 7117]ANV86506.1 molybdenum cofactor biosynthesis protein [Picosynechococcus sp. PCC 7117]